MFTPRFAVNIIGNEGFVREDSGGEAMSPRVVEVVSFLVRRYASQKLAGVDERTSVEILMSRGFSLEEIGEAFEFMFSAEGTLECDGDAIAGGRLARPVRVLNHTERMKFDLGAQGLIHMVSASGVLSQEDVESVISSAMSLEQPEVGSWELLHLIRESLTEPSKVVVLSEYVDSLASASARGLSH